MIVGSILVAIGFGAAIAAQQVRPGTREMLACEVALVSTLLGLLLIAVYA